MGSALGAVKSSGLIARKVAATLNAVIDPIIRKAEREINFNV